MVTIIKIRMDRLKITCRNKTFQGSARLCFRHLSLVMAVCLVRTWKENALIKNLLRPASRGSPLNVLLTLVKGYKMDKKLEIIRKAIADYMRSEGCSCCQNIEAHEKHTATLASLLEVPMYDDASGYDFNQFSSDPV